MTPEESAYLLSLADRIDAGEKAPESRGGEELALDMRLREQFDAQTFTNAETLRALAATAETEPAGEYDRSGDADADDEQT